MADEPSLTLACSAVACGGVSLVIMRSAFARATDRGARFFHRDVLAHLVAAIALAAPLAQAELHLCAPGFEVELQWHQRVPALLQLAEPALDLGLVHEQLARALGLVVERARLFVRRDVRIVQEQL